MENDKDTANSSSMPALSGTGSARGIRRGRFLLLSFCYCLSVTVFRFLLPAPVFSSAFLFRLPAPPGMKHLYLPYIFNKEISGG